MTVRRHKAPPRKQLSDSLYRFGEGVKLSGVMTRKALEDRVRAFQMEHPAVEAGPVNPSSYPDAFTSPPIPPGAPMQPAYQDQPTRRFYYYAGQNMQVVPRGEYPEIPGFVQLWSIYRFISVLPAMVAFRVSQLLSAEWSIKLRKGSGFRNASAQSARALLEMPDPKQGLTLEQWMRSCYEEAIVTDALTLFPVRNGLRRIVGWPQIDGSCYSDDTEVLTRSGWKLFKDTRTGPAGDEFATRNPTTKAFEWQHATQSFVQDSHRELIRFHSRSFDLLVTPNHRMIVTGKPIAAKTAERFGQDWIVPADDLARSATLNTMIPATSEWHCQAVEKINFGDQQQSIHPGPACLPTEMSGEDFAAFMGMYLAEGWVGETGKPRRDTIIIAQLEKSKGFAAFRGLLTRILGHAPFHSGKAFHLKRRGLSDYLKPFGRSNQKYVPAIIKEMPPAQLQKFWDFYVLGDGHVDKHGRTRISTVSRRMADDLQEIAQKLGFSASVKMRQPVDSFGPGGRRILAKNCQSIYIVGTRRAKQFVIRKIDRVPYTGKVYCVSVPNESLYVRRNGLPVWCANTIKPIIDNTGGRPGPPQIAYTQFIAGTAYKGFKADQLFYRPFNPRVWCTYGQSPVEDIFRAAIFYGMHDAYVQRYFSEGNIPESAALTDKDQTGNLDAAKMLEWETVVEEAAGSSERRRQLRMLPPWIRDVKTLKPELGFNKELWESIVRVMCVRMGIPSHLFTSQTNRATAEEINEVLYDAPLRHDFMMYKRVFDSILGWSGYEELEWGWKKTQDWSQAAVDGIRDLVDSGIMTKEYAADIFGIEDQPSGDIETEAVPSSGSAADPASYGGPDPNAPPASPAPSVAPLGAPGGSSAQPGASRPAPASPTPARAVSPAPVAAEKAAPLAVRPEPFAGKGARERRRLQLKFAGAVMKNLKRQESQILAVFLERAKAKGVVVRDSSAA